MHKPGFGTGGPDPLNSTPSPPLKKKKSLESGPTLVWRWTPLQIHDDILNIRILIQVSPVSTRRVITRVRL